MNKADLVDKIAGACEISKAQATTAIDTAVDSITASLRKGDRVALIGFGTFSVSQRKARNGRNPQTGATIKIAARRVAKFSPGLNSRKQSTRSKLGARSGFVRNGRGSGPAVFRFSGLLAGHDPDTTDRELRNGRLQNERCKMIASIHKRVLLQFVVLLLALKVQDSGSLPFGAWRRVSEAPVIGPRGDGWESAGTFNPAVVIRDGRIVMLYRAQDKAGTSRLGYAESTDGLHFTRRADPVFSPETDYEKDGGVEDPRLVQFGDTYYLTYTGYNKKDAQLCLATSKDLIHWERKGVIIPANKGNWNVKWTKSGAIVPEKIEGKYWMYFLGTSAHNKDQTGLVSSTDLLHWTEASERPVLPVRPASSTRAWQSRDPRRSSRQRELCLSTTAPMTSWYTGPASRC